MPIPEIDHTDREILHHLQQDGRLTNAQLAERVHLSPSPCLRRVRNPEERGVIRRYATLLDPRKVGLPITLPDGKPGTLPRCYLPSTEEAVTTNPVPVNEDLLLYDTTRVDYDPDRHALFNDILRQFGHFG